MADVDEVADELYRLPPEEFIAARDARARELTKAKERDTAKEVKALRRPTVPAWALNQLRWEAADELAELFDTTDQLRAAQEVAIRDPQKGRADLRELTQRHRGLVQKLTDAAARVMRASDRDPAPHRGALEMTLRAATTDADVAGALHRGRLLSPAEPQGFGEIPADWTPPKPTATPPRKPRPRAAKKAAPPPEPRPSTAAQRREEAARQQKVRDAERELARARRRLEAAEKEAAAAAGDVARLEEVLRSLSA